MAQPEIKDLQQAVAGRRAWAHQTLAEMVRHPSELGNEASAQHHIAGLFGGMGYDVRCEKIDLDRIKDLPGFSPVNWDLHGKENVVALHEPENPKGRSLAFNGHIDVVSPEPVKLWTTPPYEPRIVENEEDGEDWMYGRGAGDMKGGTITYLWALHALRDMGLEPASKVILQSPVEEECTGNGTLAILDAGYVADACAIPEPFNETILRSQVGVMWFDVRVLGRTTHVLGAGRGVNAIEKSWIIIQALREMEAELNRPENIPESFHGVEHPLNLNVAIINGGDWGSTVAGECVTRFRMGMFPGERCEELRARIEKTVQDAAMQDEFLNEFRPSVEYVGFQAEGAEFDMESDFCRSLTTAHTTWRGASPEELRCTATTDMRFFNLYYDTPATCYGPKAVNIHGVDEKVSLNSIERVTEVFTSLIQDWCGLQCIGGGEL